MKKSILRLWPLSVTLNLKHISLLGWGFTSVHYLWLHSRTTKNESFFWLDSFQWISWAVHVRIELKSPSGARIKLFERIDSRATKASSQWPGISSSPDLAHAHIEKECGLRSSPNIKLFDGHKSINHVESTISARFFGCRCQPGTFIVLLLLLTLGRWHDVPR